MNIKSTLKTSVAATALFALASPVATPGYAADDTFKTGNKNSVTMSGYVTKTLQYADDGSEEQLFITDGGTSESRIRWIAKGTVNESVSMGAMIELEIPASNNNTSQSFGDNGENSGPTTDETAWAIRHQYVWVNHKKFGKLSLGNTNAAGNGSAEAQLSGTTWIDNTDGAPFGQGHFFVEVSSPSLPVRSAIKVSNTLSNFDATSRTDVIRYDTPKFGGLGLAASLNGGGGGEVAGKYSGKFGPVKVLAKASYSGRSSTSTTFDGRLALSFAALHDSGINFSVAHGTDSRKTSSATTADPWNLWGAVGYKAKIFGAGGTNINVHYNRTTHLAAKGDNADSVGFTISQDIDAVGAKLGIGYVNYELERAGNTFDDIDVIYLSTIFNF